MEKAEKRDVCGVCERAGGHVHHGNAVATVDVDGIVAPVPLHH